MKPSPSPKSRLIKQAELADILAKREHIQDLKKILKQAEDELIRTELLTLHALKLGTSVEPGVYTAGAEEKAGARRPSWKEEFANRLGADAVQQVIGATLPGASSVTLVILQNGHVVNA